MAYLTLLFAVYMEGYEIIWKRVWESFCLDVEIHNTGGGSIPQTLTWFLRSSAYVLPKYSTLQAGSTLSLPLPSSLFVSSSLEVLAIFLWRTGPFITATGFVGLRTAAKTWTDTLPARPAFAVGAAVYESL